MDVATFGFVEHERAQRAWILRYGIMVALVSLLGTTLQNFRSFEPAASVSYVQWAIALTLNLCAVFWWTGTKNYTRFPTGDIFLTLPMLIWMEAIRIVMTTQSEITGWSPTAITTVNYILGVTFASLFFPANIRGYVCWVLGHVMLFGWAHIRTGASFVETSFAWGVYIPIALIGLYSTWAIDQKARSNFLLSNSLAIEKTKSDEMLYSILPEEVAGRIRAGEVIADSFSDATVVFVDLVGSSQLARNLSPRHFVSTLDAVFSLADEAAARYSVEKVKTIGDAYLAITGGRSGGDAISAVQFALCVLAEVESLARERQLELGVRIGIHTGPVVGGVIGQTRATYDYWGDTMNVAARVESAAEPGGILVTKQTYFATRGEVRFLPPRIVMLKGIGETQVYDVYHSRSNA